MNSRTTRATKRNPVLENKPIQSSNPHKVATHPRQSTENRDWGRELTNKTRLLLVSSEPINKTAFTWDCQNKFKSK